jgi:hypothetical protein
MQNVVVFVRNPALRSGKSALQLTAERRSNRHAWNGKWGSRCAQRVTLAHGSASSIALKERTYVCIRSTSLN